MPKLIVNNSTEELAEAEAQRRAACALEAAQAALLKHTANLLRVTRGAGERHSIIMHAAEFMQACSEFHDATGRFPDAQTLLPALRWELDHEQISKFDVCFRRSIRAREKMTRGALKIVASKLLEQKTQETAGEFELYLGMSEWEKAREDARTKQWSFASRKRRRGQTKQ